ncbi:cytochrome c [Sulfuricella sp.]|uniref:c-type cytochrome n=1 Tax=Sulfuricella sp. TaxID=2099377 RepID=UPI002C0F4362|nr:cytochrome c [Sulfuricella sp.]HUX64175.1 cytochrome c [Sulfuricella sp.]
MPNRFSRICRISGLLLSVVFPGMVFADLPSPARQAELLNLVRQDCGSCHGLRLEGGLGLPLTPQALREKSPEVLKQTILHGRGGTPMPPWNPFLTEAEASWIVDILLKGLPDAH